jgi:SAM-dependent methyltransferase
MMMLHFKQILANVLLDFLLSKKSFCDLPQLLLICQIINKKQLLRAQNYMTMNVNSGFTCKICSNTLNNKIYIAREMMFGLRDEFVYFQCSGCGCLQIAEFPSDISKYYSAENYYSFKNLGLKKYKGIRGSFNRIKIRSNVLPNTIGRNVIRLLCRDRNTNYLGKVVKGFDDKILDVGCGNGHKFLYPLYESGFRNVAGCDPFIEAEISYENGLKINKMGLSEIKPEWDLICFNHSFEHVSNPLETLEQTYKLLPIGGYCIIRIPTSSSFAWKHYGVNWFQLDAPRHYFVHSVESMKYLANQSNFELEDYCFDSTHHQFTISERYKMNKTMGERVYHSLWGRIYSVFQKLVFSVRAVWLNSHNSGDQAIFYLRKN